MLKGGARTEHKGDVARAWKLTVHSEFCKAHDETRCTEYETVTRSHEMDMVSCRAREYFN